MKLLVVYDVSDDSKRNKLANNLKKLGLERIQKSAFEGDLDSQRVKDLIRVVKIIVDTNTDIVHIIPLGIRDWERRIVIGKEGMEQWLV
ncbi:CRISPR-associated endonuclease Cas2 [Acidianus sulfidivorans JP7]|uniref:CRISPR-associated endoribonuclease Cas2 n=1 Tax=Acidianus sulfidivorans JP7 TaxID=619593 RepID=A0A2U9IQ06_9CREN|nr:CRISPR-associated endonuclease Cas2 [Acidianus sulfidivorans]AWR98101.1 CRISPR-associated endonuclease Cas2 [Acidianus sulfidivorans JP7]